MKEKLTASRYALEFLVLLLAAGLLALSWPRLRAGFHYLPVDTAISRYWAGDAIADDQLRALLGRAGESLELHEHYRYWDGMSILHYLRGMDATLPVPERRRALEASIEAAIEAVSLAPMRPMVWLRIAAARSSLQYPHDRIIPALKMSVFTGRVEPTLLPLRLRLGYTYMPWLDEEMVHLLRDQTLITWRLQQRALLEHIRSGAIRYSDIEKILSAGHGETLAEMEALIGKPAR